jgi:hypothetical protein
VVDALRDRSAQVLLEERHVVPVVDRPRLECEFLAEQVEEVCQRVDGRGDEVSFDPRDSGLGGASPVGQLLLGQPVAAPSFAENLARGHLRSISDLMYAAFDKAEGGEPLSTGAIV